MDECPAGACNGHHSGELLTAPRFLRLPGVVHAVLVEEPGPANALRRVREQVAAALAGSVELGDGLVEVDADAADQPGRPDEFPQCSPHRGLARAGATTGGGQDDLCRVGALGQASLRSGRAHLSEFLLAEIESHRTLALHLLAGSAPWPCAWR